MLRSFCVLVGCVLSCSTSVSAQTLTFRDGLVTIRSEGAAAARVLAEWARVGSTEIVNGEFVTGPALNLALVDAPEVQALEQLLGSVTGYVVVPRKLRTSASQSVYERILILSSTSPRGREPQQEAKRGTVGLPEGWPFQVNVELQHDEPQLVVITEKDRAHQTAWPMPIKLTYEPAEAPAPVPKTPAEIAADKAWPFQINVVLDLDDPPSTTPLTPASPGQDVWPFRINEELIFEDRLAILEPRLIVGLAVLPGKPLPVEPPVTFR